MSCVVIPCLFDRGPVMIKYNLHPIFLAHLHLLALLLKFIILPKNSLSRIRILLGNLLLYFRLWDFVGGIRDMERVNLTTGPCIFFGNVFTFHFVFDDEVMIHIILFVLSKILHAISINSRNARGLETSLITFRLTFNLRIHLICLKIN